ncbi:F0F1 ATP synthase subunit epsilon [Bartonella vinsonii]|uniref:ATP synthase epsilon chain n=1 Tax=Bartonella vinsonii subsp. berkhoffii str. Tweed TaxID=1094502 RepID=N6VIE9_BARVB|nr:F0F1 ATP synthase subunit epsilon [Bartonella vinsonii]AGF76453.1 ATP synthase epsilon chain [Bartonella vinsonii subsp. berkhoffii str. Winnie]ENN93001.1 ATP synthase epsilon chain [Bartonella vinsonii subsp. berkhoffii str. Tweed]
MENNRVECFLFELVSPEKLVFSEQVVSVVLPSASGALTVMAHHAPLVASIVLGSVCVLTSSGEKLFAVCGGVANITFSGCSLLVEKVVAVEHLSFDALEQQILQVRATLKGETSDEENRKVEEFFHQLAAGAGVIEA